MGFSASDCEIAVNVIIIHLENIWLISKTYRIDEINKLPHHKLYFDTVYTDILYTIYVYSYCIRIISLLSFWLHLIYM